MASRHGSGGRRGARPSLAVREAGDEEDAATRENSATLDVLTMGRSGVDLYPLQTGIGLEDVATFGKYLGESPTNVAVATSRLGHRTALLTGVEDDPFGRFARRAVREFGIDDSQIVVVPELDTPVTFCEIFPPDHFPLWFHRAPSAPDSQISPQDVPLDVVRDARLLWLTATGLSQEPSRSAHITALDARRGRGFAALDLDYRPSFWPGEQAAHDAVRDVLGWVTLAVGNLEECQMAVGATEPDRAADALLEAGVELAVIKQGPHGVPGKTREERVVVASTAIQVVNGLSAGDGFGGALCHGLLEGWSLHRTLEFASAAGAIGASRLECSGAMPTEADVEALIAQRRMVPGET